MENYININGVKVPLSDETTKEFESRFAPKVKELPRFWDDLGYVSGAYINEHSYIKEIQQGVILNANKNVFPTEAEAEAMLAMAQLCQLRDVYNDGWKADYRDDTQKFVVYVDEDILRKTYFYNINKSMSFKTEELRDTFLKNFRDLLEIAKPFL